MVYLQFGPVIDDTRILLPKILNFITVREKKIILMLVYLKFRPIIVASFCGLLDLDHCILL